MAAESKIAAQPPLSPFRDAVAGALGALLALTITYPLDIIKTRLQVQSNNNKSSSATGHNEHYDSTLDAIRKIISTEGILELYAGLPAGLIGVASTNFAYFYWYSFIRTYYQRNKSASLSTAAELSLGALAGILAQIFTIPVSVITTRQQTSKKTDRRSLIGTAKEIISEDGIPGLWKGLKPSMVLCVNPAITYGAFERFKDILSKRSNGGDLSPGVIFCLGALSKTIATVITYPYIMAKVRLQWKPPREMVVDTTNKGDNSAGVNSRKIRKVGGARYKGAIDVLRKVLETDGIQGWYTGMQAQITKAVLSQALLFYMKEYTTRYTIFLFALLTRLAAGRRQIKHGKN